MSKLANEIFDILKLCWSFSVAEKQYLKWVIITGGLWKRNPLFSYTGEETAIFTFYFSLDSRGRVLEGTGNSEL